jgi:pectate lyase
MRALADSGLVDAARAGDQRALAELLTAHLPLVYNVVGRALHGHPDVDDVVQETMLRVVQSLPGLREPERFRSWLIAIAVRQVQDRERRSGGVRQQPLDEAVEAADPEAEFVDDTINRLELSAERQAMVEASRWLAAEDRRILALWWQEAAGTLTRTEVAEALGITGGHAAVRIQRMKGHLGRARAVVAAWRNTPRCPELTRTARGWDRRPDHRWFRKLDRHVRGCAFCTAASRTLVPSERLIGAIGLLPVPVLLPALIGKATATKGGTVAAAGLLQRIGEYLTVKPAIAVASAVVGTAVVAATLIQQSPSPQTGTEALARPPSASAPPVPGPRTASVPTRVARPSATAGPSPTPSRALPPPRSGPVVGWGAQSGGTTGGAGGRTVTVTSFDDLREQASASGARTVQVSGNFSCDEEVRVTADKTIVGVGAGSGLTGCGLSIRDTGNVIVRNLKIAKVPAGTGNGDAIHIDNATRVWIDHNDLSSDTTHGSDFYDGLLDMTHAADYITVSWNVFHDHIKCVLVGHSDDNAGEDTGKLRITFHHNVFRDCGQRNPRVRFGDPVHVYNNYFVQTKEFEYSYGIATTEDAGVLVEANYFENIAEPVHLGEADSDPGRLVARDNHSINSGPILTEGSVAAIPYPYQKDPAASVKSIVTGGAGTGKL